MSKSSLQRGQKAGRTLVALGAISLILGMAAPAMAAPGNGNGGGNGGGAAASGGSGGGSSSASAGGGSSSSASGTSTTGGSSSSTADKGADKAGKAAPYGGYTEDNDTNDGGTPNNVADAGDNRHPSGKDRSVEKGGSGTQGKSKSDPDGMSNGGPDKPNGSGGIDKADQDGNNGCGNDDDFEDDNNGNCGGKGKGKGKDRDHEPQRSDKAEKADKADRARTSHRTCPDGRAMGADGHCGAPTASPTGTCPAGSTMAAGTPCEVPTAGTASIAGTTAPGVPGVPGAPVLAGPVEVKGVHFERGAPQVGAVTPGRTVRVAAPGQATIVSGDVAVLGTEFVRPDALAYTGSGGLSRTLVLLGIAFLLGGLLLLGAAQRQQRITA